MMTGEDLIARLGLQPHPKEGGYFRETYRAAESIPSAALPPRYRATGRGRPHAFSTAIYYLLLPASFSALHRLHSDEIFHFYAGDPVEMLQLHPDGSGRSLIIGADLAAGLEPQVIAPAGVWQGARLREGGAWALLGTTVAPGFTYEDYESADKAALLSAYPAFRPQIERLLPR
jgi:predicted cupin superfamily sugar epimerase